MKNQIIKKEVIIDTRLKGRFLRIPFPVPEGVREIRITWQARCETGNSLDFCLEDPEGFRGWSGYNDKTVVVGTGCATVGYRPGPILPGEWSCVLGAPKLNSPAPVSLTLELIPRGERWFPGDLHTHTVHSGDAVVTTADAARHARQTGLSFIALTDHNTQTQNRSVPQEEDLLLIPSMEMTTYRGHSNFWNLPAPLSRVLCETPEDVADRIDAARARNAVVSLNHPFFKDPWLWGEEYPFDSVEVWNSRWCEGNEKALEWWQRQICGGRSLTAVGGSDNHGNSGDRWYGRPVTWVRADALDAESILGGVMKGAVVITASMEAPFPELRIGSMRPGDRGIPENAAVEVDIRNPAAGTLFLISERGEEESLALSPADRSLTLSLPAGRRFLRAEIRNPEGGLLSMTNPVYLTEEGML